MFASAASFLNLYVDHQVTPMTSASATIRQIRVAVVPVSEKSDVQSRVGRQRSFALVRYEQIRTTVKRSE